MIELKHFEKHLNSISQKDWNSLFDLLPEIKSTKKFGKLIEPKKQEDGSYTFPYWSSAKIVNKTSEIIDMLNLTPIFDWMNWDQGREILTSDDFDYSSLDKLTLCKLLTCITRMDRFSDGHLVHKFKDRTVEKIIESLQLKILSSEKEVKRQNSFLSFFKRFKTKY